MKRAMLCLLFALFSLPASADTITGTANFVNETTQQPTPVDITLFQNLNGGGVNVWCVSEAGVPNTSGCSAFFADAVDTMDRLSDLNLQEPTGFTLPAQFTDPPAPVPEPPSALLFLTGIVLIGIFYCAKMITSSMKY